jgi:hypothetical protein
MESLSVSVFTPLTETVVPTAGEPTVSTPIAADTPSLFA